MFDGVHQAIGLLPRHLDIGSGLSAFQSLPPSNFTRIGKPLHTELSTGWTLSLWDAEGSQSTAMTQYGNESRGQLGAADRGCAGTILSH
jgi:hypothetical protein